jgi:hypothetical protein
MLADTARTCEVYRKATAAGESPGDVVGYLAKWFGVQRPAIWRRLRTGGVLPKYNEGSPIGRKPAGIRENRTRTPLPPTVSRDPCPRCGVRADYGCGHSHIRLGTVL